LECLLRPNLSDHPKTGEKMERNTIDFGIDLGTTNSEIAVLNGTRTEIIKNNDGWEYTPSAVYIDKSGRILIGQQAKELSFYKEEDAYTEFKRDMGTDRRRTFKAASIVMKPEELSAVILKSLKADVARSLNGETLRTTVITVPADFELPQNEATKRAAKLAGLENCPLLQEPIAAALAYGFQSKSDKVFWLVYDFGGGTFDAALIQLRDGLFRVVQHQGDNFLGGKDLDWRIVEELVVPQVLKEHRLENFVRGEAKWKSAFAKMKNEAEKAKIQLSVGETRLITIPDLIRDAGIDFEMELCQKDVARLAEPNILKSIRICKDVIKEAGLKAGDIEKLILVGGPTLAPYLREMLTDPIKGLGIPLEFSVDPMTVVARGAAIFAGGQLVEKSTSFLPDIGTFQLNLEYQPIGSDSEPQVGGKVSCAEVQDYSGFMIEISSLNYNSGRLPLGKNGSFITTVLAEMNKKNVFHVDLFDETGGKKIISPDTFTYTIGNAPSDPPLTH
jgi:molecular chaperone DnaK